MSGSIATGGYLAPLATASGGGGGPSGTLVPFELRDNSGVLQAGITGLTVQVSKDGAALASGLGTAPTSIGQGAYYYQLDSTEIGTQWTLVVISKTGYQTVIQERDFGDVATGTNLAADTVTITNAVIAAQTAITSVVSAAQANINANTNTSVSGINANTDAQVSAAQTVITGAITAAVTAVVSDLETFITAQTATIADAARDALLDYTHRTGRTVRGFIRRLDALFTNKMIGANSSNVQVYQPGGTDLEFTATQDPLGGSRTEVDCTTSEAP